MKFEANEIYALLDLAFVEGRPDLTPIDYLCLIGNTVFCVDCRGLGRTTYDPSEFANAESNLFRVVTHEIPAKFLHKFLDLPGFEEAAEGNNLFIHN